MEEFFRTCSVLTYFILVFQKNQLVSWLVHPLVTCNYFWNAVLRNLKRGHYREEGIENFSP